MSAERGGLSGAGYASVVRRHEPDVIGGYRHANWKRRWTGVRAAEVSPSPRGDYRLANWLPLAGGRRSPQGFGSTSTLPPASRIACSADLENAWALTVTFRVSSPRPNTLTRAPLCVRPLS